MFNKKNVFLIGTGSVNIDQFLKIYKKDSPIVAADGGANHLKKLNIIPDKIIGDLDSLENKEYWEEKTEVIEISDQDSTDLEKVLGNTDAPFYFAFGFAGDRFDHTLQILHVLSKYRDKNIIFFAGADIIFRLPKQWRVELPIETRISLYPLHKTKIIASEGLK
ncbi:thiamine diphosphokinase, partial [Candidatus Parcubacteria bacterium]|nr:thiamine diphosphokinase [Candidatus Parcubacteria bacterium]